MNKKILSIAIAISIIVILTLIIKNSSSDKFEKPIPKNLQAEKSQQTTDYIKSETYFSLPSYLGNSEISLKNYAGQPALIFFFSIYCHYCKNAGPFIQNIYTKYNKQGLAVIGISTDYPNDPIETFINKLGLTFPIAVDTKDISSTYGVRGVPNIYLIDKEHKAVKLWPGYHPMMQNDITNSIEHVLN